MVLFYLIKLIKKQQLSTRSQTEQIWTNPILVVMNLFLIPVF